MGTRSLTFVTENEAMPILCMYRQMDGYPSGHGADLAEFLAPIKMVNGLGSDAESVANGTGCLAAQIVAHFKDTGRNPDYYDLIVTGDRGHSGSRILQKLVKDKGYDLGDNYTDCGILIYNREGQDVMQGGSGACCCNLVFNSYIYSQLKRGKLKKVLFIPTGALVSKVSSLQGETIPAIAHAVDIEVL